MNRREFIKSSMGLAVCTMIPAPVIKISEKITYEPSPGHMTDALRYVLGKGRLFLVSPDGTEAEIGNCEGIEIQIS